MIKRIGTYIMMGMMGLLSVTALATTSVTNAQIKGFGANNAGGIGVGGTAEASAGASGGLLNIVKNFINFVLGLLSLIALVMLLWGGFQMVTAAGDDKKYEAGFTILKQAGIGIAFIGLSWFIVSFIFFVVGSSGGGDATGAGTATN